MISSLAWSAEFLLEASGAVLAYRRKLYFLQILLAFRVGADIATFMIGWKFGRDAYGAATWTALGIQYLLLIALASQLASSWIRESGWSKLMTFASALGAFFTLKAFTLADSWPHRFLEAEIAASATVGIVLGLGWMHRKKPPEKIEAGIAAGLIISLAGNAICATLATHWPWCLKLAPIPALIALGIWNVIAWKSYRLKEADCPLPRQIPATEEKKPPQSVRVVRQISDKVM